MQWPFPQRGQSGTPIDLERRNDGESVSEVHLPRLLHPTHPRLSEGLRVQAQMTEWPDRSAEDIAAWLHRERPRLGIDLQSLNDRWQLRIDRTALVTEDRAARPVDELEIGIEAKRNRCGCTQIATETASAVR